jgi:hypothetical protein
VTFLETIPGKVREETEDRIVLVREGALIAFVGLFMTVISLAICYATFITGVDIKGGLLERIVPLILPTALTVIGILILCEGLSSREVIIDKKFQSVTIKESSAIKYFNRVKKIPFSRIRAIEVLCCTECHIDHDSPTNDPADSWKITLITIDGGSTPIYCSEDDSTLKIEEIAGKIRKITDKKLPYQSVSDNKNDHDIWATPSLPAEKS